MKAGHTQEPAAQAISPVPLDFLGHFLRNFLTAGSSTCTPSPAQAAIGPGLSSILNPAAQPPGPPSSQAFSSSTCCLLGSGNKA